MSDILKQTQQVHHLLQYQGGEFDVKLIYDCHVGYDCLPAIKVDFINSKSILNPLFINKWQKDLRQILQLEEDTWNYQTLNYFEESAFDDYEVDGKRYYMFQVGYKVNFEVVGTSRKLSLFLVILNVTFGMVLGMILQSFCDFLLANIYDVSFAKAFYKSKYQNSKDFTDLRGGLDYI